MGLIFKSPAMLRVVQLVEQIGSSDAPVMLSGETGTGKEVVAALLQQKSRRAHRVFIKINCAAIPKDILESELFGCARGAFTGAENKVGVFEAANTGTLFLDELSDMPFELQVKLLRAVEEKIIKRVGSLEQRPVDVRLISAINQTPEICLEKKVLREDLYYRLGTFHIPIPPLRHRREAIPALCETLLQEFCATAGRPVPSFSEDAMEVLKAYSWPGNVRQLKNEMMRLSVLANGTVTRALLDARIMRDLVDLPKPEGNLSALDILEKRAVIRALATTHSVSAAAARLGIGRQTLYNKMKQFGVDNKKGHQDGEGPVAPEDLSP